MSSAAKNTIAFCSYFIKTFFFFKCFYDPILGPEISAFEVYDELYHIGNKHT